MEFIENIIWGWCGWDTLAAIFLIAAITWFVIRRYKLNKEIRELKDRL